MSEVHETEAMQRQLKIYQERHRQLEHEVNTVKALALSTFARMGAYTLLILLTLAVLLAPVLFDRWEPLVQPREVIVLAVAFLFVIALLVMNMVQVSRGLNRVGQNLQRTSPE